MYFNFKYINIFKGKHCPVFEKQLGRVVEDYNTHCSECPIGYDSNNSSICKTTLFYFFLFSDAIIKFNYLHVTCTCNTSCFYTH